MGLNNRRGERRVYLSIFNRTGELRAKAPENAEGAVMRKWSVGDRSGEKWEFSYNDLSEVMITDVVYKDGKYGKVQASILCETIGGAEKFAIQIDEGSNFFTSFLRKLQNVNINKPVDLSPYSIDNSEGKMDKFGNLKQTRGMGITQDGKKILDYYYDTDAKVGINGIPMVDDAEKGESWYWPSYFGKVLTFLKEETEKRFRKSFDASGEKPAAVPMPEPVTAEEQESINNMEDPRSNEEVQQSAEEADLPF